MTGNSLRGLSGWTYLQATGAATEDFLNHLTEAGVPFRRLVSVDELTLRMCIPSRDMPLAERCGKKTMCSLTVLRTSGPYPFFRAMGLRLLYLPVLLCLVALVFRLQEHIWFLSVSGNQTVPTEVILRTLEEEGVGFWTGADTLDLNLVKNRVLSRLPALSWITVNTGGGRAEVVVRERQEKPVISRDAAPADLVAKRGGMIVSVNAARGSAQVKPGDLVEEGDLLVSGVTSLDRVTLLTRAEGEIYARTWRKTTAVSPGIVGEKRLTGREKCVWSLTFGKKTVNFFKNSGISFASYDKIRETTVLTLPGGLAFPLSVTRARFREYTLDPAGGLPDREEAQRLVLRQIGDSLTAGSVRKARLIPEEHGGDLLLRGVVECQEEIARISEIKE